MKKVLLLSFVFLFFLACSSNDSEMELDEDGQEQVDGDNNTDDNDGSGDDNDNSDGDTTSDKEPLIGTWTYYLANDKTVVNDCLQKTTYVFNEDSSYTYTEYSIVNGECQESTQNNQRGEWTAKGNSMYELRRHGYTSGAVGEIKFENDNKNMIIAGYTYKRN